ERPARERPAGSIVEGARGVLRSEHGNTGPDGRARSYELRRERVEVRHPGALAKEHRFEPCDPPRTERIDQVAGGPLATALTRVGQRQAGAARGGTDTRVCAEHGDRVVGAAVEP